jgi:peptidoglycan/xylan/chitin deacetylase (PgdA/CDA1 family)
MKSPTNHPIPVIYYHSVALKKNHRWVKNYLTLEVKYFEDQLKFLKKNNFQSIFLKDYYQHKNGINILPKNSVCITFDDGYLDNWIYAFPILKKYNLKATIFVSPEFVDTRNPVRKNLDDYWNNKAGLEEIDCWGHMSWDEMRLMENSGLIDIQSHTLTHTKYFVSDKLVDFHHPGRNSVEVVGNLYPHRKPYYIEDKEFEKLIPYGYPIFEEAPAVIAMKVDIHPGLIDEILNAVKSFDWTGNYDFSHVFSFAKPVFDRYLKQGKVVKEIETEDAYKKRLREELRLSKNIIEKELNKKVLFCCWPYGGYNDLAHKTAINVGYLATTIVLNPGASAPNDRFNRFGLYHVRNNRYLSRLKAIYKIRSHQKIHPYYGIKKLYNLVKYGR